MPRPEKVQAVADIKERIQNAQAVFLAEYAGLSVAQQQRLRRELKANGAEFKVVKMTLARLAAAELDIDTLDEHLLGPTGIAIADGDAVAAAKVLKDFSGSNEVFKVKGGLLGLDYLSPERVSELADIEPRDVLLAKVAGLFAAPMGNVAGLFEALQRDTVGLVQALVDKREASGEVAAPVAEEAEVEEAPADEAPAAEAEAADDAAADEEPEAAADDSGDEGEPAADAQGEEAPEAAAEPASEGEPAAEAEAEPADDSGDGDDTASSEEDEPAASSEASASDEADDEGDADDAPASSDEEDNDGDSEEAEEE